MGVSTHPSQCLCLPTCQRAGNHCSPSMCVPGRELRLLSLSAKPSLFHSQKEEFQKDLVPLYFIGKIQVLCFSKFSRPDLTVRYEDSFNQESALKKKKMRFLRL